MQSYKTRLPGFIPVTSCVLTMTAYSSGTVRDFHPIPFSSCVHEPLANTKVNKKNESITYFLKIFTISIATLVVRLVDDIHKEVI